MFVGLYALAAAVGELREPGGWQIMVDEFIASPALRVLAGVVCIALGGAIFLLSPWRPGEGQGGWLPDDWLAALVSIIGAVCLVEGLFLLAAGKRFLAFSARLVRASGNLWAGAAALIGVALIAAAIARI